MQLKDILDQYLVVDDTTGERVRVTETDDDTLLLSFGDSIGNDAEYFPDESIHIAGDNFSANDINGNAHFFRAYTIVKLKDK